ncbi:MAG: LPS assembly lipoprotein LptE [Planctomycetia bacterium]|nr:LPS assembly lipoprotein LptE [Planctomycetia bacterium]
MRTTMIRRTTIFCVAFVFCAFFAGCGAMHYQFGNDVLFDDSISTIHVPVVRCESFRVGLGEQMTEAIVKEIETRTPYKVVGSPSTADTTLVVRIVEDTKTPRVRTSDNQARQMEMGLEIEVSVYDHGSETPRQISHLPLPNLTMKRSQLMIPEAGQTVATTQLRDMERIAADIVSVLETTW